MIWLLFGFLLIILVILQVSRSRLKKTHKTKSPSEPSFLNINSHKICYLQNGTGDPLILLHGLGASIYSWRFLFNLLSNRFNVTAIDLLGFGQSDKPQNFSYNLDDQAQILIQILDQLKIKKAYLVGSSMGGALALWLANQYPERFCKIVTMAPAIDPKVAILDLHNLSFISPLFLPMVTPLLVKTIMNRVITNSRVINHESIHNYYAPYAEGKSGIRAFVKSFSLLRDERLPSNLKDLKVPHLMIWGKGDKIVSFNVGERLEKKISNTKLIIHPSAGHHIMEDDPQWVSERVFEFLQ